MLRGLMLILKKLIYTTTEDSQTQKHTTRSVGRFVDEVHDVEVLDQGK